MIKIIVKLSDKETGEGRGEFSREFPSTKKGEAESIKFLEGLDASKMQTACTAAGLGPYRKSLLIKATPKNRRSMPGEVEDAPNAHRVKSYITIKTEVNIIRL